MDRRCALGMFKAASNMFGIRAAMANSDLKIPAGNRRMIELDISGETDLHEFDGRYLFPSMLENNR